MTSSAYLQYRSVFETTITVVGGSGSVTALGHYGDHPRPRVADRGMPSRKDKRVAPDKKGAADKQCLGDGTLISNPACRAAAVSYSHRAEVTSHGFNGLLHYITLELFRVA